MTEDPRHDATAERLRRAMQASAQNHEPGPDGLTRIEEKLMQDNAMSTNQKWIIGGLAAVAALLVVALVGNALIGGDGDTDIATGVTSSTTTVTTPSTVSTSTTSTTVEIVDPPPAASQVIFPSPGTSRRFSSPETAANGFAEDVAGMVDPVLGEYEATDQRSGEVSISDRPGGPQSTIFVEKFDGDTWYVTGAQTADIVVEQPAVGATLATPFATNGRALAFEGVVDVVVFGGDQFDRPRGSGFVMGSGAPPAGPFDGRMFFTPPAEETAGVIVYRTLSAEDGHVERVTAIRVTLSTRSTPSTPDGCGDTPEPDGATEDDRVVIVYFHCSLDETIVPIRRTVPLSQAGVLRATLGHLFAGPTEEERDGLYTSPFPVDGNELIGLVITDGVAVIDLNDAVRRNVPNASAAILEFESEVFRTATQFSTVTDVEVHFNGSCDAYGEWSQKGPGNCRLSS